MTSVRTFLLTLFLLATTGAKMSRAETAPPPTEVSLNFQNTDIDNVLKFISDMSGRVFIKSDAVRGYITLMSPAPVGVGEALDILQAVLEVKGFTMVPGPGKLLKVLTAAEAMQSGLEVSSATVTALSGGGDRMMTQVVPLRHLAAGEMKTHLTPLMSRSGNIIADERMNSLVITDMASNIRRFLRIIESLDLRSPQVLIEALIVEVSLTEETKLGIEWSNTSRFNRDGHGFNAETSQSFGVPGFVTEGLKYSVFRNDGQLAATLQALATDKRVNILSTPHILTVNNQPAFIRVGEEVPVLTQTRNIQGGETIRSFDYKQVAIELEVTPRINPDREVLLKVHPLVKKILGFNAELNAPILATREAQTSVQVSDGQTVVIGGLMKDDRSSAQSKVPLLGDIPLIGYLFKRKGTSSEKTELLVFITPRVIANPSEAEGVSIRKESESKSRALPHRRSAKEAYKEGRRMFRKGQMAEAIELFSQAERQSPDTPLRRKAARWKEKALLHDNGGTR